MITAFLMKTCWTLFIARAAHIKFGPSSKLAALDEHFVQQCLEEFPVINGSERMRQGAAVRKK
jgi:hypothetical protein